MGCTGIGGGREATAAARAGIRARPGAGEADAGIRAVGGRAIAGHTGCHSISGGTRRRISDGRLGLPAHVRPKPPSLTYAMYRKKKTEKTRRRQDLQKKKVEEGGGP